MKKKTTLILDLPKAAPKKAYLVTVSGGLDSMVLAHAMHEQGLNIVLAHANFQLRGVESDADATFILEWANKKNIKIFSTKFSTSNYATQQGISIQMAARELRYNWFATLCELYHYQWIVTGHHFDDQMETFLINVSRGAGLKGLLGIPHLKQQRLRPLRNYTKAQLEAYAIENQLVWREDSSNAENKYLRNRIRNNLIPLLDELIPEGLQGFQHTLTHLSSTQNFIQQYFDQWMQKYSRTDAQGIHFLLADLQQLQPLQFALHQLFTPYGFEAKEVEKLLQSSSGKYLSTTRFRLLKERQSVILVPQKQTVTSVIEIPPATKSIDHPIALRFQKLKKVPGDAVRTHQALLNLQLLKYPLKLRKWQKGDYFYPSGMHGKKLLSKYFKDQKYSTLEKENQWLLCSENKIVWIVGKRCDRRFTSPPSCQEHLLITQI